MLPARQRCATRTYELNEWRFSRDSETRSQWIVRAVFVEVPVLLPNMGVNATTIFQRKLLRMATNDGWKADALAQIQEGMPGSGARQNSDNVRAVLSTMSRQRSTVHMHAAAHDFEANSACGQGSFE